MTLYAPYDPENIFAKILQGEMPCVKVYEDGGTIAFMDVFPQSKGHCLVLPRAPSRNLLDMAPKNIGRLFGTVQRVSIAVEAALKPDGLIIRQNNGPLAEQTVFHTHVHIIPRYSDETLNDHNHGKMADLDALEKTAAKIRSKLEAK